MKNIFLFCYMMRLEIHFDPCVSLICLILGYSRKFSNLWSKRTFLSYLLILNWNLFSNCHCERSWSFERIRTNNKIHFTKNKTTHPEININSCHILNEKLQQKCVCRVMITFRGSIIYEKLWTEFTDFAKYSCHPENCN